MDLPTRLRRSDDGATAAEYFFLLLFIAVAIIAGLTVLNQAITAGYDADCPPLDGGIESRDCEDD